MYNKRDLLFVLDKLSDYQQELIDIYKDDPASLDNLYYKFNQTACAIDLAYRVLSSGLSGTYFDKKQIIDFFEREDI